MANKLTYKETLDYLYTQLPMFQRVGQTAFKKDLTNIIDLTDALGKPQDTYPTLHIAGTNGKGTTAHILSAILQQSGYKVGLYTSPHYLDFRERIKVNGALASRSFVVDFVEENKDKFGKIQPSFFEITVAMAFQYFKEQKVDIAIIETGLGGRLDSTNIIKPILSVITNISFDHQQFLGDTLESIATEKAGIIKENIPIIIGEYQDSIYHVFSETAKSKNAPITCAEDIYETVDTKSSKNGFRIYDIIKEGINLFSNLSIGIQGPFQAKNINTAIACLPILKEQFPNISNESIKSGLRNVCEIANYQGRWQIISESPKIILDSAHNEAGLAIVMDAISKETYKDLHIVMGMVNDKSHDKVLKFFPKDAIYYFAKADIPRGLEAEKLELIAKEFDLIGKSYSSVKNAFSAAKCNANHDDLIFVGGSIFVIAEVL